MPDHTWTRNLPGRVPTIPREPQAGAFDAILKDYHAGEPTLERAEAAFALVVAGGERLLATVGEYHRAREVLSRELLSIREKKGKA